MVTLMILMTLKKEWWLVTFRLWQCFFLMFSCSLHISEMKAWLDCLFPLITFYIFKILRCLGVFYMQYLVQVLNIPGNTENSIFCSFTNSGNCQMVMRSSILVTTLILFSFYVSNFGIFFTLDSESQMEKGRLDSMQIFDNDNFVVGFLWFKINFNLTVNIMMGHHHNPVLGFQDRWPNVSLFHLVLLQYRPAIQVKPFCFPPPFASILNAILIALCSSWTMFFTYIWLYWSDRGYVVIIGSSTTISKLGNNFRWFHFFHIQCN